MSYYVSTPHIMMYTMNFSISQPFQKTLRLAAQLAQFGNIDWQYGTLPEHYEGDFLQNAELLFIDPFHGVPEMQKMLPACPNLKWVHSLAAGVDKIAPDLLKFDHTKDIPLTNAKGAYSSSLAEWAVHGMLYFNKMTDKLRDHKEKKIWDRFNMPEVKGKTVGFAG